MFQTVRWRVIAKLNIYHAHNPLPKWPYMSVLSSEKCKCTLTIFLTWCSITLISISISQPFCFCALDWNLLFNGRVDFHWPCMFLHTSEPMQASFQLKRGWDSNTVLGTGVYMPSQWNTVTHSLWIEVHGAEIFTKLNIWSAYNLIRIREGDEWEIIF